MRKFTFLFLCIFIFLMSVVPTVQAVEEIHQYHVKNINLDSPAGLSFSTLDLQNIEPNSQTNFTLNCYGQRYYLNITAEKEYSSLWSFDVSVKYPNETIETKHVSNFAPLANSYNLKIDSFWWSVNNSIHESIGLNLYTTVRPLTVNTVYILDPLGSGLIKGFVQDATTDVTALPFSSIEIDSSSYYDLTLFAVNEEELKEQEENSIFSASATTHALSEGATQAFSWTWTTLLSFLEKIPLVGTHIAGLLVLVAMTLSSILFYTKLLFIDYSETTFITIECFILAHAYTRSGNFWVKFNRVVHSHIILIQITIMVATAAVSLFAEIVHVVSDAIDSLKPV